MTTTRRAFLITATAAAPAMALPALGLPSPADATALCLWAERQSHVERLCVLTRRPRRQPLRGFFKLAVRSQRNTAADRLPHCAAHD